MTVVVRSAVLVQTQAVFFIVLAHWSTICRR